MSPQQVELALKKQRLQIRSAALRAELAGHAAGLAPWFAAGDRVRDGAQWLRRHPAPAVAVIVALAVARPRAIYRLARRSFVGWQLWIRMRTWIEADKRRR